MKKRILLQSALGFALLLGAGGVLAATWRGGGGARVSISQGTGLHGSQNPNGQRVLMQSSHQPIVASTNKHGAKVLLGIQTTVRTVPEVKTAGWQIH